MQLKNIIDITGNKKYSVNRPLIDGAVFYITKIRTYCPLVLEISKSMKQISMRFVVSKDPKL